MAPTKLYIPAADPSFMSFTKVCVQKSNEVRMSPCSRPTVIRMITHHHVAMTLSSSIRRPVPVVKIHPSYTAPRKRPSFVTVRPVMILAGGRAPKIAINPRPLLRVVKPFTP